MKTLLSVIGLLGATTTRPHRPITFPSIRRPYTRKPAASPTLRASRRARRKALLQLRRRRGRGMSR